MVPRDQQERIVGMLIAQTQAGALKWSTKESVGAGLLSSEPRNYLESRSDGILFRLSLGDGLIQAPSIRVRGLLDDSYPDSPVRLDVIDAENSWDRETIIETPDLSILKILYGIASGQNKNLQKKLSAFLGKKAG